MSALFSNFDADHDGQLTYTEFVNGVSYDDEKGLARLGIRLRSDFARHPDAVYFHRVFARLDVDVSGVITSDEFLMTMDTLGIRNIDEADALVVFEQVRPGCVPALLSKVPTTASQSSQGGGVRPQSNNHPPPPPIRRCGHHRRWRERVQGKGSEWRLANRRRQLQTRTTHHGDMPTPLPPSTEGKDKRERIIVVVPVRKIIPQMHTPARTSQC